MAKRKRHTEEFKREAVAAVESRGSRSIADVTASLGIAGSQLYQWRAKYGRDVKRGESGETLELEVARLRQENIELRRDRDTLKKSVLDSINQRNT